MPFLCSFQATCSVAYRVATNTSTRDQSRSCCLSRCRSNSVRLIASTAITRWTIAGSLAAVAATSTRTGSRSSELASVCTSGGKVAEKNKFCRRAGSSASTRCSSSEKPRSSSRSASSSTSICTASSFSALCSSRSSSLPGVATTASAPPRSPIICGLIETPPNTTAIFGTCGRRSPRLRSTSPTWAASSRVGTSTRARTRRGAGAGPFCCSRCSRGKPKAPVLPEPVWADPTRSLPARMAGMACAWIGVGV